MNPVLHIFPERLRENVHAVVERCRNNGISVMGVTKGTCAHPAVARVMADSGCTWLADSRVQNLERLHAAGLDCSVLLLRIPMPSEIPTMLDQASAALVSMPETISMIEKECAERQRAFQIIVMVDIGDLREGIWPDEAEQIAERIAASPHVHCLGVGANFGCFGGVLPTEANMITLVDTALEIERHLPYKLEILSGGATSSLQLLEEGKLHPRINQLRIGEAMLLGSDVTRMRTIPYLRSDAFLLEAEIVEVRRKPSIPIGEIGADAFGHVPHFEDRGKRLRAIVGIGRQDVVPEDLTPVDDGVSILGASSDHLTLDVEDMGVAPQVGDTLDFTIDYGALLALSTSSYVKKTVHSD